MVIYKTFLKQDLNFLNELPNAHSTVLAKSNGTTKIRPRTAN